MCPPLPCTGPSTSYYASLMVPVQRINSFSLAESINDPMHKQRDRLDLVDVGN
eukprot:m.836158 g.836158  ORF g.836158 m.836158 type:complete len:53 (-) comp23457_c1_seq2:1355-1513(-)